MSFVLMKASMARHVARRPSGRSVRKSASGQALIESIAGIILFTLLLTVMMSITVYLYFQQALVTAAREGARQASLNSAMATGGGTSTVEDYVKNQVRSLTGQTFNASTASITVTPPTNTTLSPDQTPGNRNVRVVINWRITNPIGVAGFINALGGNGEPFRTIPVAATATMRYEE